MDQPWLAILVSISALLITLVGFIIPPTLTSRKHEKVLNNLTQERSDLNVKIQNKIGQKEQLLETLQEQVLNDKNDIDQLKQRINDIYVMVLEKDKENVLTRIQLQLNQIEIYYTINRGQATSSFTFCVISVSVGFLVLIAGIGILYFNLAQNLTITILTSVAGILLQFVGGSQFLLYRNSIKEMSRYFNQLTRMQDTLLAIEIAQSLSTPEKQEEQKTKIIAALLERSIESDEQQTSPS
ncbi:hypothetical protein EI42_01518 [Thermosporothrix hazakensis]|jgi:exonuclease VII large subunit|uniref:Cyanobacterial TRADD-N associated 2 transmembrane domain-containing protein n=1 Tax=Thermosporothrix hazakensis TaxID=644383 RepID=A0A326UAV6_THEHA|nr:hypothetical protein [Thermosporothrix hazakensis]PZW32972.1 hypothetical protein EI42_01518 [Thermosporothrix hazakensis]GCE49004.1 hypothetical protein KTH_38730 [Thermosporothrix hazakensis]